MTWRAISGRPCSSSLVKQREHCRSLLEEHREAGPGAAAGHRSSVHLILHQVGYHYYFKLVNCRRNWCEAREEKASSVCGCTGTL